MSPIESHLTDYLRTMLQAGAAAYCRQCLTCWAAEYGEQTVTRVMGRLSPADREALSSPSGPGK